MTMRTRVRWLLHGIRQVSPLPPCLLQAQFASPGVAKTNTLMAAAADGRSNGGLSLGGVSGGSGLSSGGLLQSVALPALLSDNLHLRAAGACLVAAAAEEGLLGRQASGGSGGSGNGDEVGSSAQCGSGGLPDYIDNETDSEMLAVAAAGAGGGAGDGTRYDGPWTEEQEPCGGDGRGPGPEMGAAAAALRAALGLSPAVGAGGCKHGGGEDEGGAARTAQWRQHQQQQNQHQHQQHHQQHHQQLQQQQQQHQQQQQQQQQHQRLWLGALAEVVVALLRSVKVGRGLPRGSNKNRWVLLGTLMLRTHSTHAMRRLTLTFDN